MKVELYRLKLVSDSFRFFSQKRWEKLSEVSFRKCAFIEDRVIFDDQCAELFSKCEMPIL